MGARKAGGDEAAALALADLGAVKIQVERNRFAVDGLGRGGNLAMTH
jgi:hypothetical protein